MSQLLKKAQSVNFPAVDHSEALAVSKLVRELNGRGHNPATSGNYSIRSKEHPGISWVSESGIDKSLFTEEHLLLVDQITGKLWGDFANSGRKSSDETSLHLAIYRSTDAGCVLHTHFLESLLFADLHPGSDHIVMSGLELLKGFKGIKTHNTQFIVPCFDNTQDMETLGKVVEKTLKSVETYGVLLRGHGLYVWGGNVAEAKRHLEVFEYLFRYYVAGGFRR